MCFLFHKWSKWQVVNTYQIYTVDNVNSGKYLSGKMVIQQRVCEKCGKVQMNKQKVEL